MRRARTDDVSHSARYLDNIPSSRSMSDVRGDDDTPAHPASDAQRTFLTILYNTLPHVNVNLRICLLLSWFLPTFDF